MNEQLDESLAERRTEALRAIWARSIREEEVEKSARDLIEKRTEVLRVATVATLPGSVVLRVGPGSETRLLPEHARELAEMLYRAAEEAST